MSPRILPVANFALFGLAFSVLAPLYIRVRASPLLKSGRLANSELSKFLWATFVWFAGWTIVASLLQKFSAAPTVFCLALFPPRQPAGAALWLLYLLFYGVPLWWVWTAKGGDFFARLAPVFAIDPVLARTYSIARVRLVLSAVIILGPLGNIAMQFFQLIRIPDCAAI